MQKSIKGKNTPVIPPPGDNCPEHFDAFSSGNFSIYKSTHTSFSKAKPKLVVIVHAFWKTIYSLTTR